MSDPRYIDYGAPEIKVIEELSEVAAECQNLIKEICKAYRFGYFGHHPLEPLRTNIDRIKAEMDDCVNAFEKLEIRFREVLYKAQL